MAIPGEFSAVGWGLLAFFFFGGVSLLVFMRRVESKRVENRFEKERVLITSFGVNYFGLTSEAGGPARSAGTLVLLKDGIYYRARFSRRELFIPCNAITSIGVVETHKGRPLYQKAVSIGFVDSEGREVSAAFRIPFPDQWISAIRGSLLSR